MQFIFHFKFKDFIFDVEINIFSFGWFIYTKFYSKKEKKQIENSLPNDVADFSSAFFLFWVFEIQRNVKIGFSA